MKEELFSGVPNINFCSAKTSLFRPILVFATWRIRQDRKRSTRGQKFPENSRVKFVNCHFHPFSGLQRQIQNAKRLKWLVSCHH